VDKLGRTLVLRTSKGIYLGGTLLSILPSLYLFRSGRRQTAIVVGLCTVEPFVKSLPSELAPALFKIRGPGHTPPHGEHGESLALGIVWASAKCSMEVGGGLVREILAQ
jgi:hypothetical protein